MCFSHLSQLLILLPPGILIPPSYCPQNDADCIYFPPISEYGKLDTQRLGVVNNAYFGIFLGFLSRRVQMAKNPFLIEEQSCGIASQLSLSRHPLQVVLNKQFRNLFYYIVDVVNRF